jgi:hypothetical protein
MYNLSLLAMFKNESWIIKEWISHYLLEGVDHFYLIDNGSNDNYEEKIKEYKDKNYISLVKDSTRLPSGTQSFLYKKIFLDKIKNETKWIIVCDIDEYIYARNGYNKITDVLNKLPQNVEKIWLNWKIFGSNGHINQPSSTLSSFTKRTNTFKKDFGDGKCISRTRNIDNFGCCGHNILISGNNTTYTANGDNFDHFDFNEENCKKLNLHLNHYMLQSEEYYLKIKCSRGGGESGLSYKYTLDFFKNNDKNYNDIIDTELCDKKNNIIIKKDENKNKNNTVNNSKLELIFHGNDKQLFEKYINNAKFYFEYGAGSSTYYASLKQNLKKIIVVESDKEWYNKVNNMIVNKEKFNFNYIEMNSVPNTLGKPGPNSKKEDWIKYSDIIRKISKDISSKIDLVLIDGRFRVACCLKCFNIINDNCVILFNDFLTRDKYHVLLDFYNVKDKTNSNTMAVLTKKKCSPPSNELIKKYEVLAD